MCFSRTWNIGNCPPNQTHRPASTREEKNAEEEQVEEEVNKEEEEEEEDEINYNTVFQRRLERDCLGSEDVLLQSIHASGLWTWCG